ncbi:MAG TPA: tripartite tricarboxylate transporter substrate binding protein [Rhizomicrobium sp.]|nr:tripartite tricarboxylate transporter substrate binding protein [Rhizomicrobium sp.]
MKRQSLLRALGPVVLILAFAAVAAVGARAVDDYPSKPVRFILPQPAGGAVDLIARAVAERLSEQMNQPVIVENMPGANGSLAAEQVARSLPDGYTLLFAVDSNLVINPHLYKNLNYDPLADFTPISIVARLNMVLVANPKVEANSVRELIAFAKAHPGKLNYASIGLGTSSHLGMEMFKRMTATDITMVSYRGTAPAMTDVVGGVVDVMFTGPPSARVMSEGGKLKLLAFTAQQRSPLMPSVPTMIEAGVPGFDLASWFGVLAPAKTPSPITARLSSEVTKAAHDPRFASRLTAQGLDIVGSSPDAMLKTMQADTKKWGDLIDTAGIKIDQ